MLTGTSTALSTICSWIRGTGAAPRICVPPWVGGDPLRWGPLGVVCPTITSRPHVVHECGTTCDQQHPWPAPRSPSQLGLRNGALAERRHGHFHQLLSHLRGGESRSKRRGGQEILGTSITCSGTEMSMCLKTCTSWSTICGTGTSRICAMGAKSAGCSTVCRWPPQLCQAGRPDLPRKRHFLRSSARSTRRLRSSVPVGVVHCDGSGWLLSPRSCVVRCFNQCHRGGHPLVAKPLTEPSLSPPRCGARHVFNLHDANH